MPKYTRALQRHAFTQLESERETFQEQILQEQTFTQQELIAPAVMPQEPAQPAANANKNGKLLYSYLDTSWLFDLAPDLREGYLRLGQNLLLAANSREVKTIILTSPEEQEDAALVAAEFAAVLASDMSRRVLLVDGDVRRSSLSRLLGRAEHLGLREALLSNDGMSGTPLDSRRSRLAFLSSGVGKPEFVFHLSAFQEWERSVRAAFDYILIHTPPLSLAADGTLLGKHADGVILIAQTERTDRVRLTMAKEQMEKAQCQMLGVVLTHAREYLPHFLRRYLNSRT